jgi:hypothetical protein
MRFLFTQSLGHRAPKGLARQAKLTISRACSALRWGPVLPRGDPGDSRTRMIYKPGTAVQPPARRSSWSFSFCISRRSWHLSKGKHRHAVLQADIIRVEILHERHEMAGHSHEALFHGQQLRLSFISRLAVVEQLLDPATLTNNALLALGNHGLCLFSFLRRVLHGGPQPGSPLARGPIPVRTVQRPI